MTESLTTQQVFNTVRDHLLAQGHKSYNTDRNICMYRNGPDRCAVGALFTDAEYSPDMEGADVRVLDEREDLPTRLIPHIELLMALQRVHDEINPDRWPEYLSDVAKDFNLLP